MKKIALSLLLPFNLFAMQHSGQPDMARTIAIMSLMGSLAYTGMHLFEARKGYDLEINKQTKLLHIASEKGGSFYNFKKENNLIFLMMF